MRFVQGKTKSELDPNLFAGKSKSKGKKDSGKPKEDPTRALKLAEV